MVILRDLNKSFVFDWAVIIIVAASVIYAFFVYYLEKDYFRQLRIKKSECHKTSYNENVQLRTFCFLNSIVLSIKSLLLINFQIYV